MFFFVWFFMTCFRPVDAWKSLTRQTENGRAVIAFKLSDAGIDYEFVKLPCGQCVGCRIDRSKAWALRCVHEASRYSDNCFITLTFGGEFVNCTSLVKSDFQKFIKRLRKRFIGFSAVENSDGKVVYPIRYFHCGEYGSELGRPHHHACLFNFDFVDRVLWSVREGVRLYRSDSLEELWPFGFATVGDVTFESAAYVARYVTKKINGDESEAHYRRVDLESGEVVSVEPEYVTMSRRPGIGHAWFEEFGSEAFSKDFTTFGGRKFSIPVYYDRLYDAIDPVGMASIKETRKARAEASKDKGPWRLVQRERCAEARVKRLKRGVEDGS